MVPLAKISMNVLIIMVDVIKMLSALTTMDHSNAFVTLDFVGMATYVLMLMNVLRIQCCAPMGIALTIRALSDANAKWALCILMITVRLRVLI